MSGLGFEDLGSGWPRVRRVGLWGVWGRGFWLWGPRVRGFGLWGGSRVRGFGSCHAVVVGAFCGDLPRQAWAVEELTLAAACQFGYNSRLTLRKHMLVQAPSGIRHLRISGSWHHFSNQFTASTCQQIGAQRQLGENGEGGGVVGHVGVARPSVGKATSHAPTRSTGIS